MSKQKRNVIILKNIRSNMFDEAIFVLKKDVNPNKSSNKNLVQEARQIVEDYVNKNNHNYEQSSQTINYECKDVKRDKNINAILNISLILSIILFVLLLWKTF